MIDLDAIRARNEDRRGALPVDAPAMELPHPQTVADIDALLAEVERLRGMRMKPPICAKCGFAFLHESNFDRHPCPPPSGYDFGAP